MIEVLYRVGKPEDINFILSTWLKSFRKTHDNKRMHNDVYYPNQTKLIERTLQQAKTLIIANKLDPSHIYGYIVYEGTPSALILHYAYIKRTYRRFNLFNNALESILSGDNEIIIGTHANDMFDLLAPKYGLIYNMYMKG